MEESQGKIVTKEQENMIRVCTRDYMDTLKKWPNSWITRKRDIICKYKQIERLIDSKKGYMKGQIAKVIGNLIVDEWRKYE